MINRDRFEKLVHQYITGTITEKESFELKVLLDQEQYAGELDRILKESYEETEDVASLWSDEYRQQFIDRLMQKAGIENTPVKPVVRGINRFRWMKYAAAIILVLGTGVIVYLWTKQEKSNPTLADTGKPSANADIAPGGERALLTLADGRTIQLDSAANGQLAEQGGVEVIKMASGQIAYRVKAVKNEKVMWNTMSTPRGGQYQLILPDGTNVWLNAASSITYPTAFLNNKREVTINGEVFLEVVRDEQKPFFVNINGKSSIQVLGTSFNINSYDNEEKITTTLVKGSIRINEQIVLQPGQQAIQFRRVAAEGSSEQNDITVNEADIDKALAWKNGWFNFNGASLYDVMRQLERWYDIDVRYEGDIPKVTFKGKMDKGVTLSGMLNIFSTLNFKIKTRLEGRTLIVSSN